MKTRMHLCDRIEPAVLQDLQDAFAASIGITVAMADPQGNPITDPSHWGSLHGADAPGELTATEDSGFCAFPEPPPAAVMIFASGVCLGQCLLGGAQPRIAPPNVRSLIFMPLAVGRETFGALGFEQETIRHWPPKALAHVWNFANALAEKLGTGDTWEEPILPARFDPIYGRPASRPRISL